jgi:hypothetical protein
MAVQETYLVVAEEAVAYGTLGASLTRGYEATADAAELAMQYMESNGMRAGFETTRSSRVRAHQLGGTGSIEVDFMSNSMGLLLKAAVGTQTTITGPPAGYKFVSGVGASSTSLSVQMVRGLALTAGTSAKTYLGGRCTSWELMQANNDLLKFKMAMDFQAIDEVTAAGTAAYPTAPWLYAWPDCTVTVDGNAVEPLSLSIKGDTGIRTDRFALNGTGLKSAPYRNAVPPYAGSMEFDYDDDDIFDLFASGDTVPIVCEWAHPTDADFTFTVTMDACQVRQANPKTAPGQATQTVEFVALDDGTNPAVDIEYITDDVAA